MARSASTFARPRSIDVADNADTGLPVYDGYNDAFLAGTKTPVIEMTYAGQMGWTKNMTYWANSSPYVSCNVIALLIEPPMGFRAMPNSSKWINSLRALVETMPKSITGLNWGLNVNVAEKAIGGGGQAQFAPTNVQEERVNITFSWIEVYGMAINRFLSGWIRYLMRDPNADYALINTIAGYHITDLLPDQYSMTMLFIEPDPICRTVQRSWLVTNLFPRSSGQSQAKREKGSDGEIIEMSIEFGGCPVMNAGVDDMAQGILNNIFITGADPWGEEGFIKDIDKVLKTDFYLGSYKRSVERLNPINKIVNPDVTDAPVGRTNPGEPGSYPA